MKNMENEVQCKYSKNDLDTSHTQFTVIEKICRHVEVIHNGFQNALHGLKEGQLFKTNL